MPSQHALAKVEHLGRAAAPGMLAALMSLTTDAVLAFDGAYRILAANPQAEALTGFAADELVGSGVCDFLFDSRLAHTADPAEEHPCQLPLSPDGSLTQLSLRLAQGGSALVAARCDRIVAPGETYLVVMRPADASLSAEREHDRLLEELSLANRRLSGTLRIVLETIDVQDVDVLFSEVLEQIADTMEALGTLLYLAEADGFRLRGVTRSLEGARVPQFMAYGEGLETIATRAGSALRLRLVPPSERSLRSGSLSYRELIDDDTGVTRRIPARQAPPFASLVCVPVWFGGHVIAIMEVGWAEARPTRRDDARLLDSVAQYLSIELAAALTAMRTERTQRLDAAAAKLHAALEDAPELSEGDLSVAAKSVSEALAADIVTIRCAPHQSGCIVALPDAGDTDMPLSLDDLVSGHVEMGVAVVPFGAASPVGRWLAGQGQRLQGAIVDVGELGGRRHACLVVRPVEAEPLDDVDLDFLRRACVDIREMVAAGERRSKDTRIAQALQSGMRNSLQRVEGITGHGLYSSATASAMVGGDFYDLIRLPNRKACVILGDVSGKGVEAASVSAAVKTAIGAYAWEGLTPSRMVRLLNDFLLGFSRLETFATMFVGMVDLRRGTLAYCSAGHPPALLLRAGTNEMESLDEQSGVVGAFRGMPYHDGHVSVGEGDRLFLYTDGVTEARDPSGAFFGEQGLHDAVMEEATGDFDGLLDRMLSRLDAFTDRHLDDDVAMVALRFDRVGASRRRSRQG